MNLRWQIAPYFFNEDAKTLNASMENGWKCAQQQWSLRGEVKATFFSNFKLRFWMYVGLSFWIEVLFLHEGMKEISCKIKLIVSRLGFAQIHIPWNKKWTKSTQRWKKTTHTTIKFPTSWMFLDHCGRCPRTWHEVFATMVLKGLCLTYIDKQLLKSMPTNFYCNLW
jgi:hypothetical protein